MMECRLNTYDQAKRTFAVFAMEAFIEVAGGS